MNGREVLLVTALGLVLVPLEGVAIGNQHAFAIGPDQKQAELANALSEAKVSLQQGLAAANPRGSRSPESSRSKTANSSFRSIPQRTESFSR